ncbi:hypothetical protein P5V15_013141 [Pogonomyrmex californicus]
MGRSKLKKKLQLKQKVKETISTEESTDTQKVPINNLPEKFLWMHVKSGTKIRNVLGYALKEFPNYNSIVWTGIEHSIAKTISCAEIFKRKHKGLHQITKLRNVRSEKSGKDTTAEIHRVPEIHILLSKDIKDTTELGYQAPENCEQFLKEDVTESKIITTNNIESMPNISKQFTTMERIEKRKNIDKRKYAEPFSKKKKIS